MLDTKLFFNLFILCALVFCLHICLCEGVGSPGSRVTGSCELPCGCWEWNLGLVEERPVLLTAEPSLQPQDRHKTINLNSLCSSVLELVPP